MKPRALFLSAVTLLFSANAYSAGQGDVGKVVVGRGGDQVYVELTNASVPDFACSSTHPNGYQYAFSLQTHPNGKAMLATILAAKAAGKRILVQGLGACTIDPTIEDAAYVIAL